MSPSRFALDTNVLVYAEGIVRAPGDAQKVDRSRELVRGLLLERAAPIAPVQVLAELHRVLTGKAGISQRDAEARARRLIEACDVREMTATAFGAALEISSDHRLQIFDAMILAVATEARADVLLSEDMQDGFVWRGLTVCNPFSAAPDERVTRVVAMGRG